MYARTSRSVHASERKKVSIYSNALCRCKARKRLASLRSRLQRTPTSASLVYRISVYARTRDARARTKIRRRRGRKRKTRAGIVVEETFDIIRKLAIRFFLFYQALRIYSVIYVKDYQEKTTSDKYYFSSFFFFPRTLKFSEGSLFLDDRGR